MHIDVKPLIWSLNVDVLSGDLKEPTHLSLGVPNAGVVVSNEGHMEDYILWMSMCYPQ